MEKISFYGFCNGKTWNIDPKAESNGLFDISWSTLADGNFRRIKATLRNCSTAPLVFHRAFIRVLLPPGPYEFCSQYNRWSQEDYGRWAPLNGHGVLLGHLSGRTTEGNTPFCAVRRIGRRDGGFSRLSLALANPTSVAGEKQPEPPGR